MDKRETRLTMVDFKAGLRVRVMNKTYGHKPKFEGMATIKKINQGDRSGVHALVEFDDEPGQTFERWVFACDQDDSLDVANNGSRNSELDAMLEGIEKLVDHTHTAASVYAIAILRDDLTEKGKPEYDKRLAEAQAILHAADELHKLTMNIVCPPDVEVDFDKIDAEEKARLDQVEADRD